jgi:chromosome segregation ATPase
LAETVSRQALEIARLEGILKGLRDSAAQLENDGERWHGEADRVRAALTQRELELETERQEASAFERLLLGAAKERDALQQERAALAAIVVRLEQEIARTEKEGGGEIGRLMADRQNLQSVIADMQRSPFWRLRRHATGLLRALGLRRRPPAVGIDV